MLVPGEDQTAGLPVGLVLPSGLEWAILKWTACEARSSEGRRGALQKAEILAEASLSWKTTPQSLAGLREPSGTPFPRSHVS